MIEGGGEPAASLEVDAAYRVFEGGCPSYNEGGTAIDVELGDE